MPKIVARGESPAALPAGDARREAQRQAADALAQEAEMRGVEGGAVDPRAFQIDNEIAQHFNELEVSEAQPEFAYCWVQAGYHGRFIKMKQTERVPEDGRMVPVWEIVQGDMPEALELRGMMADTTRRLGDVILMRARKDRYFKLRKQREAHNADVQRGITAELEEMGRRYRGAGVVVTTDMDANRLEEIGRRAAIRAQAGQMVDGMIRNGTVPGLGEPGSR